MIKHRHASNFAFSSSGLVVHDSMQGYAYILTHPGIPTVFYDHFYNWGDSEHSQIVKLVCCMLIAFVLFAILSSTKFFMLIIFFLQMDIRKCQDIHNRSSVKILEARSDLYSAIIGEKLCMKIGDGSWYPSGTEWTLATSGPRYAVWQK